MKQPKDMNMVSKIELVGDEDMRILIEERMAVELLVVC